MPIDKSRNAGFGLARGEVRTRGHPAPNVAAKRPATPLAPDDASVARLSAPHQARALTQCCAYRIDEATSVAGLVQWRIGIPGAGCGPVIAAAGRNARVVGIAQLLVE